MRLPHLIAATLVLAAVSAPAAARTLGSTPKARASATPWIELEAAAPNRLTRARVGGRDALRVSVKPGDSPTRSGERTEMVYDQASTLGYEGRTVTYRWSTRFPSGFRHVAGSTWNLFAQWHETDPDGCHPNMAVQINAKGATPVLRLQSRGGRLDTRTCEPEYTPSWDFTALRYDEWYDFALRVRWSADPALGYVELSVNGQPLVTRKNTPTLYRGQGVYFKQGFYRAPSAFESVLYHTPVSVTPGASASRRR
jgi:Polysaccharide lyase